MEKLKIAIPIAVEGKYDKIKLSSVVDGQIITTDGFRVFASDEKAALIRRLAEPRGMIVLTDSDGAGLVIRNYFNSILPKDKLIHLYTPRIPGKEKRKTAPSKAGWLGVEGMEADLLRKLLAPYAEDAASKDKPSGREITKADLYADGLSGGEGSAERRAKLCEALGLPPDLSANALLAALNLLIDYDKYEELIKNG
ncbi:MAG: DUF4093 domain-containing protein [Clostridia bacterium]|nr:DUF4093 domain-containing protein [Clostridia bacterium]